MGQHLAKQLEHDYQVKIIDHNHIHCRQAAETLDNTLILEGEASNKELLLEENIEDNVSAKVLLDKESPFLKSVIINKGTRSKLKKGMPVLHKNYLIGRVVEVNYLSSRVLLLNDLNSKIPVIIEPTGHQAIMSGIGDNIAILDFLPKKHKLEKGNIVYTSGSDGIFQPGIPIGTVTWDENENKFFVEFFSELNQLYFVNIIDSNQSWELER